MWTYKDLLDHSSLLARVLYGAGIRQNDVISIVSENRFEYPAIVFGAFYLSAIVAPINTTYTERKIVQWFSLFYLTCLNVHVGELAHSLRLSKPRFIFTTPSAAEQTFKVCKNLKFVERVIVFGGKKFNSKTILFDEFIRLYEKKDFDVESFVAKRVSRDQIAYIANSSGTTGMPSK